MFRRFRVLLVFCILLSVSTFSQANPGGVGDGIFDMQSKSWLGRMVVNNIGIVYGIIR